MIKDINFNKLAELANKHGGVEKLAEKLIKIGEIKAKKKMIPVLLGVALVSSAFSAGITLLLAEQALKNREKSRALKEAVQNASEKADEPDEVEEAAPEEPDPAEEAPAEEAAEVKETEE